MKKISLIFFLCVIITHLTAQQEVLVAVRHLSTRNGLADNHVKYIYQDKKGLIWLNTADGMQRFDGNHFFTLSYQPRDPARSLPSGIMNFGITEDDAGNIWSVTEHEGPVRYSPARDEITSFNGLLSDGELKRTHTVIRSGSRILFSSAKGCYEIRKDQVIPLPGASPMENMRNLLVDRQKNIWATSPRGFYLLDRKNQWHFRGKNPEKIPLLEKVADISASFLDEEENILFSAWDWGPQRKRYLYRYNISRNNLDSSLFPSAGPNEDEYFSIPTSITQDKKGNTWVGTMGNHIYVFDPSLKLIHDYARIEYDQRVFAPEFISYLFCDQDGRIWFSCHEGLFLAEPAATFPPDQINIAEFGFSFQDENTTLAQASPNSVMINNIGKGFFQWQPDSRQFRSFSIPFQIGPYRNYNHLLVKGDKRLFFSPWFSDAVLSLDIPSGQYKKIIPEGITQSIAALGLMDSNALYVAGKYFIWKYDHSGKKMDSLRLGSSHTQLTDWKWDKDGFILAVDTAGSLFQIQVNPKLKAEKKATLSLKGKTYRLGLSGRYIILGTLYEGLHIFDRNFQPVTTLTTVDGLLSNKIHSIFTPEEGPIWIKTANGYNYIQDIRRRELFSVPKLNKRYNPFVDALPDGKNGFYILYREKLEHEPDLSLESPRIIPLVFTLIQAGEKSLPLISGEIVELPYPVNTIRFDYAAIDYLLAGSIQYRYRLNGQESDWIYAGNTNTAIFSGLKPGSYRFEAQYRHPSGRWVTGKTLRYEFRIGRPFWKNPWFYLFILVLLSVPVFIILRRDYLHRKKIERIRGQLSRDLHDDVGSTLSSIGIYSSILENRVTETDQKKILEEIREKTDSSIQNMADIVWAINPENDRLSNLIQRLKTYSIPLFESSRIEFRVVDSKQGEGLRLSMLQRRNIFLAFKEALNNTLKYAKATQVTLSFDQSHNVLQIILEDNGIGFDESSLPRKNGLNNIRFRIEEIGGRIEIRSALGKGCRIEARIPPA